MVVARTDGDDDDDDGDDDVDVDVDDDDVKEVVFSLLRTGSLSKQAGGQPARLQGQQGDQSRMAERQARQYSRARTIENANSWCSKKQMCIPYNT